MPDSKAFLLVSNRNGNRDIFKQSLGERTAQPVLTSPEDEVNPTLTPDGQWILYFTSGTGQRESSANPVFFEAGTSFRRAVAGCAQRERVRKRQMCTPSVQLVCRGSAGSRSTDFLGFRPNSGKGPRACRIELSAPSSSQYDWDLSPDGSQIVGIVEGTNRLWVLPLSGGGPKQEVVVKGWSRLTSPHWSADAHGWYVPSMSPPSLLYVIRKVKPVFCRELQTGIPLSRRPLSGLSCKHLEQQRLDD
jgi:hypothetical protein